MAAVWCLTLRRIVKGLRLDSIEIILSILILRQSNGDKATGVAQRTHGTTDPGGVWHPVHRKECLTIL